MFHMKILIAGLARVDAARKRCLKPLTGGRF